MVSCANGQVICLVLSVSLQQFYYKLLVNGIFMIKILAVASRSNGGTCHRAAFSSRAAPRAEDQHAKRTPKVYGETSLEPRQQRVSRRLRTEEKGASRSTAQETQTQTQGLPSSIEWQTSRSRPASDARQRRTTSILLLLLLYP